MSHETYTLSKGLEKKKTKFFSKHLWRCQVNERSIATLTNDQAEKASYIYLFSLAMITKLSYYCIIDYFKARSSLASIRFG